MTVKARAWRPKLARPEDAAELCRLLWICRSEIPLDDSIWSDVTLDWLADRCKRRRVWVVRVGSKIAGAIVLHHEAGARPRAGDWAEAKYLLVAPEHRRRGVARALLRHIMARWTVLRAFANVKNRPIRELLAQEAFVQHGAISFGGWIRYWWPHPVEMVPQASPPKVATGRAQAQR